MNTESLTAADHSALFDLWRNLHNRGNTFEDAQDYCDEMNLLILQRKVAQRNGKVL